MAILVAKFGGSSLADAGQFEKVRQILSLNPDRRYVVPSAPGKRFDGDDKVTDLLYRCHALAQGGEDFSVPFSALAERYLDIKRELGLGVDIEQHLDQVRFGIANGQSADYAASRGEYLNGLLLADYLGVAFIDAAEVVFFDKRGRFDAQRTNDAMSQRLATEERAVIPGFYGSLPDGLIKTFSRGGSDITGAIVSRAAQADEYENWTDVDGFLMADPRIVHHPRRIKSITYKELRELSYMGASVLHEEAIFPVREAGIPIHILNTNRPQGRGTMIVPVCDGTASSVTGIAGRKGYSVLLIDKAMMNSEIGFGRRVLQVLEEEGIVFEHMPSGIDTMSVVVQDAALEGRRSTVERRIRQSVEPDHFEILSGLSLIATVGRGMVSTPGMAARLFGALASAGINVRMIDQGSSEINIIVGVMTDDFEPAIRAVYQELVDHGEPS